MSLGKNIIVNYIGRTWSSIIAIALIPVYIKFMGIEDYGLVGFLIIRKVLKGDNELNCEFIHLLFMSLLFDTGFFKHTSSKFYLKTFV